jgi:hypothetical protein
MSYHSSHNSSTHSLRKSRDPRNSHESFGLPHEEYRDLCRSQDIERLETHLSHNRNRSNSYAAPRSSYREAGLSQHERLCVSEVRSATRAALGPSFDFDDHSLERSRARDSEYSCSRGWCEDAIPCNRGSPIPKKYRDEFDRRWHGDTEDNDADQYLADHVHNAPWREHEQLALPRPDVEPIRVRLRTARATPRREDSGYGSMSERQSLPSSKFSFDSDYKRPSRMRGFMDRLRRDLTGYFSKLD